MPDGEHEAALPKCRSGMLLRQAPLQAVAHAALVGGAAVDAFVSGRIVLVGSTTR